MSFVKHIGLRVGCAGFMIISLLICGMTIVMLAQSVGIMVEFNILPSLMSKIATSEIITTLTNLIKIDLGSIIGTP